MPPKLSNKKTAMDVASWYHCEVCDVHITSKERETHEENCPIEQDAVAVTSEYIRNNCLYTSTLERRTFNVEELKEMPAKYLNNIIYISEGAMRLSHICIGQRVVIRCVKTLAENTIPLVRMAWPTPEKFLTTIFVSDEDFELHWSSLKGEMLKVEALPNGSTTQAKYVHLNLNNVNDSNLFTKAQLKDVARILKFEVRHLIFTIGSQIHMNFFNKDLSLTVTSWNEWNENTSHKMQDTTLEQAFDNLSLKVDTTEFFEVGIKTDFEIEQCTNEDDDSKAIESKQCITKSDIGGLEDQIKIIEECMDIALGFKFISAGVKPSRSILLYGPSGCGKSLICEAICTDVQAKAANVIRINTGDLFSKFLGETEKNLTALFDKASANYPRPTLIIVEDVHNLCPKHETNELMKRVCISFLNALDGLSSGRKEARRTFLLATTSKIDDLNPNVRRSGRLDTEVEIGAPIPKQRTAILSCLLHKVQNDITDDELAEVAQTLHGYVGADLANLIYNAVLCAPC